MEQIILLKETAEKAGLQISFDKIEFMTHIKLPPNFLVTEYRKINKVNKFRYIGEII